MEEMTTLIKNLSNNITRLETEGPSTLHNNLGTRISSRDHTTLR